MSELASVLIVEDEYLLAIDLKETLRQAGFASNIVSSGEEALRLFMGGTITYRALVTDVRLRGCTSGWELARRVREKEPAFPVVYVTGSSFEEWATECVPKHPDPEGLHEGTVGYRDFKSPQYWSATDCVRRHACSSRECCSWPGAAELSRCNKLTATAHGSVRPVDCHIQPSFV